MDTYNLIKYKIWKLLNLYNDMNQIFIQYNIKKLKTIIYSCDDSLENNVDFVLSSCAFKSLTEFYNENNLKYESLLHVALTRQKKSLYVGIYKNGDDINKRFEK